MKYNRYIIIMLVFMVAVVMSCRDESLYPLPYADKEFGGYLRMYKVTSSVFDLNDMSNSAFDVIFEAVDEKNGDNLSEVEFYVSHRRGTALTNEVLLKKVPGSEFSAVPQPTISIFKRAAIKLTANEILTALQGLTDPDGAGGLAAYPGGALIAADQVIIRWVMVLKDGKRFSVINLQNAVNPAFGNPEDANTTPNITGGQFYSSPFIFTMVARSLAPPPSWIGTYSLTQTAIWSPAHSWALNANMPSSLNQKLFPDQTVTLATVPGGLSTERQFQVSYRGQTVTMKINMENGTVFVPLQYSGVDCSGKQLFWTTPTTGNFTFVASVGPLPAGMPQATTANRGVYTAASDGQTPGNTLIIGVDDDADEYGLRNGRCTWTRRVKLLLTKL